MGVDASSTMRSLALATLRENGVEKGRVVATTGELLEHGCSFDLVHSVLVFQHLRRHVRGARARAAARRARTRWIRGAPLLPGPQCRRWLRRAVGTARARYRLINVLVSTLRGAPTTEGLPYEMNAYDLRSLDRQADRRRNLSAVDRGVARRRGNGCDALLQTGHLCGESCHHVYRQTLDGDRREAADVSADVSANVCRRPRRIRPARRNRDVSWSSASTCCGACRARWAARRSTSCVSSRASTRAGRTSARRCSSSPGSRPRTATWPRSTRSWSPHSTPGGAAAV